MITQSSIRYGEPRFPRVGSPPGEVHEYKLTPEQLAEIHRKYGPPNKNKGKKGARSPILTNYEAHQRKKRRKRQGKSFPLTKEEYLKLKEQGWLDKQIAIEKGIYQSELSRKKREWGLVKPKRREVYES